MKEVSALVGDYNWKELRNKMIIFLSDCKNEIDFLEFCSNFYNSIGTKKQLEKVRKDRNLRSFNKKDLELFDKLENLNKK